LQVTPLEVVDYLWGYLTPEGIELARRIGLQLPRFVRVISSDAPRAQQTAKELSGQDPVIDWRAGFYGPVEERAAEVSAVSALANVSYLHL
jgi:broad specificity phosphatase PhoE